MAQHRPAHRRQQAGQVRLRLRGGALLHHHRRPRYREIRMDQGTIDTNVTSITFSHFLEPLPQLIYTS